MSAYNLPTGDFVTSTLNGALTSASTSATIGAGLNIPATNGVLEIDYDSTLAVGVDTGPETIFYTSYNSGTGALTGITRALVDTIAVAHNNSANVQAGMSVGYLLNTDVANIIQGTAWTTFANAATGFSGTPTSTLSKYLRLGSLVFIAIEVTGTSNSTSTGFTLPVAPKNSDVIGTGRAVDNITPSTPLISLTASSTAVQVSKDNNGGNIWTGTAVTKIFQLHFFYEI